MPYRRARAARSSRGSAFGGAPRCVAALLALALLLAAGSAGASRVVPHAVRPAAPLTFPGLAWDLPGPRVNAALAALGFAHLHDAGERPPWRGRAFGRMAGAIPEYDADGRLVALMLRFEPDPRGSRLQRYAELVDSLRARHGRWTVQVVPGRPADEERFGRSRFVRRYGPRTAATLWTDVAGGGAVVQLDEDGVLWLRYESPRWPAAARPFSD